MEETYQIKLEIRNTKLESQILLIYFYVNDITVFVDNLLDFPKKVINKIKYGKFNRPLNIIFSFNYIFELLKRAIIFPTSLNT
jgi:hypothetical protein